MTFHLVATTLIRLTAYGALVWAILCSYRLVQRHSRALSLIFAAGLATRVVLGVALFAISYFRLPILERLQLGEGFWTLALDGRFYFDAAAMGFSRVSDQLPSPAYLRALALWMSAYGISPLSSVLFNLACYVGVTTLIVAAARSVRAAAVSLSAVTFSPALLIFGTQPLKDSFSVLVLGVAIAGVYYWTDTWHSEERSNWRRSAASVGLLATSVFLFGGIRPYVAVFLVLSVAAVCGWALVTRPMRPSAWLALARRGMVVVGLWACFALGAGLQSQDYYWSIISQTPRHPSATISALDVSRKGFLLTGGATSIGPTDGLTGGHDFLLSPPAAGLAGRARALMVGCAALFVPISALQMLSITHFSGGHGLLFITDLDTVVMDVTLIASLFLLYTGRSRSAPVSLFVYVFVGITTVAMAYVVTNFGTLFRLRLLMAAPLWILPAFASASSIRLRVREN